MAKNTKSKGSSTVKAIAVIIALIVVAYVVLSLILNCWNPANWTKKTQTEVEREPSPNTIGYTLTGEAIVAGRTYEMPSAMLLTAPLAEASNSEYVGGTEFTMTATLSNPYINAEFEWSVSFAGETADETADYPVTVEPLDSTSSAKVKFLKASDKQVIITVSLIDGSEQASCTVDFLKHLNFPSPGSFNTSEFDCSYYFEVPYELYPGTVEGRIEFNEVAMETTPEFQSLVQSYLNFDVSWDKVSFFLTDCNNPYLGVATDSYGKPYIEFDSMINCEFSSFIKGFDDFDDEHKEAVYYAWYKAYCTNNKYLFLEIFFDYYYGDVVAQNAESYGESITSGPDGFNEYENIKLSINMNQNIVF